MELTWLADTPQSRNRTRAVRACPNCQRRKKRCRHTNSESAHSQEHRSSRKSSDRPPTRPARRDGANRSRYHPSGTVGRARPASAAPVLPVPGTERFVGDLNPEAVIREKLNEPTGNPLRDRIGLWISSATPEASKDKSQAGTDAIPTLPSQTALESYAIVSVLHRRHAAALQACEQLPMATREALTPIYFSKVNRIIPLLHQDSFSRAQTEGTESVFLERALCLVAAKDRAATPHLRLIADGPIVSPRQFCSDVYKGLVVAMDAELESDRVTRIRVLALMSLHCEGYEGAEAASLHLCQAIHQAQTVGLHLDRPGRASADSLTQLFWCLWTLDKMHASIGARPVLLADRDIGISKPNPNARPSRRAFDVWFAVSDLLATVISFYRPSADTTSGWEEGFPAFEDIVGDAQEDLDFATLCFLELYYHSVAILSCRHKLVESFDTTKLSSIRQGLAAVRIHSIVASECADLAPLPLVPYAVALSMGVSYRQLRSSKLITHIDRAKASLEACCALLEGLSCYWYSAEAMARLGRKALHQIEVPLSQEPQEQTRSSHVVDPNDSINPSRDTSDVAYPNEFQSGEGNSTMPPATSTEMATGTLGEPSDLDATVHGFADIDTLFGELFDLSLPTNFWDPIFMETPDA
ncbi:hypothetical protein NUU61_003705 [Penicillium alfredii]|uniref:Xylanolytic transcriptional activator regulatory domain-containing protein n=1 Tax=Penicillium alfredii TaxID=1506179 RepID=A0A9W9FJP7_9EURO|nr:uncharacterized protein NUU61_003705 [Penicillium alfredii]KAJ5101483.1 hypothetical protein NUU61_003705 [Penicillium alfredii]